MENKEIYKENIVETVVEEVNQVNEQAKKKKSKILFFIAIAAALCTVIFAFSQFNKEKPLTGKDKIAYDLIINASYSFKDPSSVRLVSGMVSEHSGSFVLSATNGFGARNTNHYLVMEDDILNLDDEDNIMFTLLFSNNKAALKDIKEACEMRDQLDVKNINKHLAKYWN